MKCTLILSAILSAMLFTACQLVDSKDTIQEETQQDSYTVWNYQVTEVNGDEVYGENLQYEDFPTVYLDGSEVELPENVRVGDWVVVIFNHDYVKQVIKPVRSTL